MTTNRPLRDVNQPVRVYVSSGALCRVARRKIRTKQVNNSLDYQFDKHFTLDEANAMIPHVRRLFDEIQHLMQPLPDPAGPIQPRVNGNGHGNGNGNGNGNGHTHQPSTTAYDEWSEEKRHEAAYRLLNALQQQGIVIQDVERGLIDFPSIQNGREVFLCYELNDGNSIEYFHDLDAGYAGRQKITGEQQ